MVEPRRGDIILNQSIRNRFKQATNSANRKGYVLDPAGVIPD